MWCECLVCLPEQCGYLGVCVEASASRFLSAIFSVPACIEAQKVKDISEEAPNTRKNKDIILYFHTSFFHGRPVIFSSSKSKC